MSLQQKPDSESVDSKESRTPAKKNRTSVQLGATEEEEDSVGAEGGVSSVSRIRSAGFGYVL